MMSKRFLLSSLIVILALAFSAGNAWAQEGTYAVAILIVDDFTGVDLAEIDVPADQQTCAVSLEGQAYAARGASAEDAPISEPHGELVYAELEALIADAQAEAYISLVRVDIQGYTPEAITEAMQEAINENPADVYIANMSFALIPCEYISALADLQTQLEDAHNKKNKNQYRNLFERSVIFYDDQVFPVNSNKFQETTGLDPLQDFLAANNEIIVPIASAGNFGLDYPFWPGAWGQVISVSGSQGQGFHAASAWDKQNNQPLLGAQGEQKNKKGTRISNYGEVMMPGEYMTEDYGVILGTSFAAPRLTLVMARYLSAVGTDFCRKDNGSPALATGDWDNLTLAEAVSANCPAMEPYLPQS